MNIETGDLIFFKGNSFISKLVSEISGFEYTHVALYLGNGKILEANRIVNVRITDLNYNPKTMQIKRYHKGLDESQKDIIINESSKFKDVKYDYIGVFKWLIRFIFKKDFRFKTSPNSLFCSELIDIIYSKIGIDLVPERELGDVVPKHLFTSSSLVSPFRTASE